VRILIGNHIDPAIRDRSDMRAWTQRILWFSGQDDLVVLCSEPDTQFLRYVSAFTRVDPDLLKIVVTPPGNCGDKLLDPETLTEESFLRKIRESLGEGNLNQVEEIFALWPSAGISRFAAALGLTDRYPGAAFFAQAGGEVVNNKAVFRALAAGAGVPIARGAVCRSEDEAVASTRALLQAAAGAVVVKQAHNGAGVGNELLLGDHRLACDHVGARHLHHLPSSEPTAIEAYWQKRWSWASAAGRFPVVVEEFIPEATSLYSEHHADDAGTHPSETGTLLYVGRRLSHQIVPLRDIPAAVHAQLVQGGTRLARTYRAIGYRGYLSADAVATPDGQVLFTEVNAQVSGSLHIYQVIAHRIVDTGAQPVRSVVEYHVPPTWAVADLESFLTAVSDLGCAYDPITRTGVIVSMPAIALEPGRAQFVFCIAYEADSERIDVWNRLNERFALLPANAYAAHEHVGIPVAPPVDVRSVRR
jgi:hypothetical protein